MKMPHIYWLWAIPVLSAIATVTIGLLAVWAEDPTQGKLGGTAGVLLAVTIVSAFATTITIDCNKPKRSYY